MDFSSNRIKIFSESRTFSRRSEYSLYLVVDFDYCFAIARALEKDLKDYLAKNSFVLERGLKLIEKEFDAKEVGRMDLLLTDTKGMM